MRALFLAAVFVLALTVPASPVVDEAEARPAPPVCVTEPCAPKPCLYGSDSDCIVRIVCVTEPCNPQRFP